MEIKIPVQLPDGWEDKVVEKLLEKGDFVEVVRCKDCKNHNRPRLGYCSMTLCYMQPDDYCSYGKREEGEKQWD